MRACGAQSRSHPNQKIRMKPVSFLLRAAPAALLTLGAAVVHAGTNNFVVPEFRGSPDSEAGYWESFTVPFGLPGNLANMGGSTTGAILTQTGSPASFITGTGNIYDFSTALQSFMLTDATPFSLGMVVL